MTGDHVWADAVPNLLIGLREGLEGGLVVSILLAAVRRSGTGGSTRPIWLGVLGALVLSLSFGAVLTFSKSALSTHAQEAFGGTLSVIAVVLVTGMIFWMRRTARGLSGELNAKVDTALKLGAGALVAIAFLAVGREGLETALFLWTAVQASGETVAPLIGAAIGVGAAVGVCFLLYRRAIRINLGVFFARTAIALVVIAGGVLAYGIGDLQEAQLLPGRTWLAFDLTNTIAPDSWWVSIIRGVTNLTPAMTWLQVVAFVVYIAVVLVVFNRAGKAVPAPAEPKQPTAIPVVSTVRDNRWLAIGAVVLVPLLAVGAFALFTSGTATGGSNTVTITASACAPDFTSLAPGNQNFTVVNKSGRVGEVYFVQSAGGGAIGELESIGPSTQQTMTVTVAAGSYAWRCLVSGHPTQTSNTVRTTGGTGKAYPRLFAVPPLQPSELDVPIKQYQTYVAGQLVTLAGQVATLNTAITTGNTDAARTAWLPAQLTWERVGAAYGSFGDLADAIDGSPQGRPLGVNDPGFAGLRRIEYGLWHGQPTTALAPVATRLTQDVATLQQKLPSLTVDPKDMPIRAHEILEDAQRDHLSGMTDQGAGTGYAETLADVDGTRVVLSELESLINERKPGLTTTLGSQLDTLANALRATEHNGVFDNQTTGPLAERQHVNAAIGQVLETISPVPDLLEIGAS
jgi:high-affinity iron transporter